MTATIVTDAVCGALVGLALVTYAVCALRAQRLKDEMELEHLLLRAAPRRRQ